MISQLEHAPMSGAGVNRRVSGTLTSFMILASFSRHFCLSATHLRFNAFASTTVEGAATGWSATLFKAWARITLVEQ